ncbi:MAG: hypothetical protein U0599_12610 [Vicinamibacteria bacterium]
MKQRLVMCSAFCTGRAPCSSTSRWWASTRGALLIKDVFRRMAVEASRSS